MKRRKGKGLGEITGKSDGRERRDIEWRKGREKRLEIRMGKGIIEVMTGLEIKGKSDGREGRDRGWTEVREIRREKGSETEIRTRERRDREWGEGIEKRLKVRTRKGIIEIRRGLGIGDKHGRRDREKQCFGSGLSGTK
jgi:hypothetical protein